MARTQEISAFLREAATDGFHIRVDGDCMSPLLENGSLVLVTNSGRFWPGDILVYQDAQRRILVHRLLGYYPRKGRWKLLIQADNARRPDMGALSQQVLGRVTGVRIGPLDRARALGRFIWFAIAGRRSQT